MTNKDFLKVKDMSDSNEDTIENIISAVTNVTPRKIMRNMHMLIEEIRINEPNASIINWELIERLSLQDELNDTQ